MMEFQWKWLAALLILVMVPEKATSAGPRVVVQATGDTWITLLIMAPADHVRGQDVAKYRIDIEERFGGGKDTRFVSKHMSRDTTSVTLGELSPSITYLFKVTPIYRDRREGESAAFAERTLHADVSKYGGKDSREEMMSSGTALTSYRIAYFLIYVIVSWVVGFSVNM